MCPGETGEKGPEGEGAKGLGEAGGTGPGEVGDVDSREVGEVGPEKAWEGGPEGRGNQDYVLISYSLSILNELKFKLQKAFLTIA